MWVRRVVLEIRGRLAIAKGKQRHEGEKERDRREGEWPRARKVGSTQREL